MTKADLLSEEALDPIVTALRSPDNRGIGGVVDPKAVYATKPRGLLDIAAATIEDLKADCTRLHRQFMEAKYGPSASPVPAAMREQVARIVDLEACVTLHGSEMSSRLMYPERRAAALAKADAILSALRPLPEEEAGLSIPELRALYEADVRRRMGKAGLTGTPYHHKDDLGRYKRADIEAEFSGWRFGYLAQALRSHRSKG